MSKVQAGRELGLEAAKGTPPRAEAHQGHSGAGPAALPGTSWELPVAPNTPAGPPKGADAPADCSWGRGWEVRLGEHHPRLHKPERGLRQESPGGTPSWLSYVPLPIYVIPPHIWLPKSAPR